MILIFFQDFEDDKAVLWECYPNAFDECYSDKTCSLYELDEEGFQSGKTGWEIELVNENPVKVVKETFICDLKARLREEIEKDNLVVHYYEETAEYQEIIIDHLTDKLIRSGCLEKSDDKLSSSIKKHHMKLLNELREKERLND